MSKEEKVETHGLTDLVSAGELDRLEIDKLYVAFVRQPADIHKIRLKDDALRMVLVMSGGAELTVDGQREVLEEGRLCIAGKDCDVSVALSSEDDVVCHIFISEKVFCPEFFDMVSPENYYANQIRQTILLKDGPHYWMAGDSDRKVAGQLATLLRQEKLFDGQKSKKLAIAGIAMLFELLQQSQPSAPQLPKNAKNAHASAQAVLLYDTIRNNISRASLAFIADKIFLHPNYMCRLVKDLFGKTFSELLNEIKMDMATDMLENSDAPIESISADLGYKSANYFYRVFKERLGVTPGQYREQYNEQKEAAQKSGRTMEEKPKKASIFGAVPIRKRISSKSIFDNMSYRPEDTAKIFFMPASMEYNYIMSVGKTIAGMAEGYNAQVETFAPQTEDINVQMKMLKEAIDKQADAIILNTHDEYSAAPLIKRAWENGIMVCMINYDNLDCPSLVHAMVGYRQRDATYHIGRYIAEKMQGKEARVGIIQGGPSYHSNERCGGFIDAVSSYSNFEIRSILNGSWTQTGGFQAAMDMLEAHPDINMIFCANDSEAAGAVEAIKMLRRDGTLVLSNDGDVTGLEHVATGKIAATVNTMPNEMARVALQVVMHGLQGDFKGGYVETPTSITDNTNVGKFMR